MNHDCFNETSVFFESYFFTPGLYSILSDSEFKTKSTHQWPFLQIMYYFMTKLRKANQNPGERNKNGSIFFTCMIIQCR